MPYVSILAIRPQVAALSGLLLPLLRLARS